MEPADIAMATTPRFKGKTRAVVAETVVNAIWF